MCQAFITGKNPNELTVISVINTSTQPVLWKLHSLNPDFFLPGVDVSERWHSDTLFKNSNGVRFITDMK